MNASEKTELEQMNGVDPYEDEIEDGVPGWLYALMIWLLMFPGWFHREGKSSPAAGAGTCTDAVRC